MKEWIELVTRFNEARPVTSGSIYHAVQEIAQSMNLGHIPLFETPSMVPHAYAFSDGKMVLSKGLLKQFENSSNEAVDEIRSIIGHELNHLKRGVERDIQIGKTIILAGIPANYANHYFLKDRSSHRSQAERFQMQGEPPSQGGLFQTSLGRQARLITQGAAAGMLGSMFYSWHVELDCDRAGAAAGSPRAMKNALTFLGTEMPRSIKELEQKNPEVARGKLFQKEFWNEVFAEASYRAHPPNFFRTFQIDMLPAKVKNASHAGKLISEILLKI